MGPINQFFAVGKVGDYSLVKKIDSVDMLFLFVNLEKYLK